LPGSDAQIPPTAEYRDSVNGPT